MPRILCLLLLIIPLGCQSADVVAERYKAALRLIDTCSETKKFFKIDVPIVRGDSVVRACFVVWDSAISRLVPGTMTNSFMRLRYGQVPTTSDRFDSLYRLARKELKEWEASHNAVRIDVPKDAYHATNCDAVLFFSSPYDDLVYAALFPQAIGNAPSNFEALSRMTRCLMYLLKFDKRNNIIAFEYGVAVID